MDNSSTSEEEMRVELLEMLKEKSHKKGKFILSSGNLSEHYINCKPVILSGEGLSLTSFSLLELVEHDSVAVAGLTLGADPLVSGVAMASTDSDYFSTLDALIVRKEPKDYGTESQVEGPLPPKGSKITVLEDVVTTGCSSIKAVRVLREIGYEVNRVVTIVDRHEGGLEAMEKEGLELYSLFSIEDFV